MGLPFGVVFCFQVLLGATIRGVGNQGKVGHDREEANPEKYCIMKGLMMNIQRE
jgi:hypothetical protein